MPIVPDANQALMSNQAFIHKINTLGAEKVAGVMTDFIRTYIREAAFSRKIIPPKEITATDLVQQLESDQPMRIVEMDQRSTAYPVTYLEPAQQRYYKGRKFPVYYQKYNSEEFYKPVEELMTYRTPIKTLVQENYLKDIQIAEDKTFIDVVDAIIDDGRTATHEYSSAGPLSFAILAEGLKLMANHEVPFGVFLIAEVDFLDLYKLQADKVGSLVMEDIVVNGFSYTKLLGHMFIRTLKKDIVVAGTIYCFTTPDYLGVFDILTDVKAFIKQEGSHLRFYLWETVGVSIGNVNGVGRIKLTA